MTSTGVRWGVAAAAAATVAALAAPGRPAPLSARPVRVGFVAAEGADFAALRRGGAESVKLLADWSQIEPHPGGVLWDLLDRAVDSARAAGLRVVLVLAYTPGWASPAGERADPAVAARQPPRRLEEWERFVTAAATRYRGRVRDWQIWTARSLPVFRGTTRQYLQMLQVARVALRAADPSTRIAVATPYGLDLPDLRGLMREASEEFDVVSLQPRGIRPEALLRPLAAIRERIAPPGSRTLWLEWDPLSAGPRSTWPGQLVMLVAVATAAGVEEVFWAAEPTAVTQLVLETLARHLGRRPYEGFLVRGPALLVVYGGDPPAAVAWSAVPAVVTVSGDSVRALGPAGDERPVRRGSGGSAVEVGPEPVLLVGVGPDEVAEARRMRSAGMPLPPGGPDFSASPEVSALLGQVNQERGLYNMAYRSWRGEARRVVALDGVEAVATDAAAERVYVRFDVDDSFLYFVDGRVAVDIAVEVRGAPAPRTVGFNVLYDSMSGYRFTPWQWVDVSPGWVTHTVRLLDAAFANTWGFDFALNAAGNRQQDLVVRSVTVRKVGR
jgi:hypothetical protein